MVFDLRRALLRKEEIETARLLDFAFRLRARSMRLLAPELGLDPDQLVVRIAEHSDSAILDALAVETGVAMRDLQLVFQRCQANARAQLVVERGDPAPHSLG